LRSWDRRIPSSKPAWAAIARPPTSKNKHTKKEKNALN
jgi:hypothetical protein